MKSPEFGLYLRRLFYERRRKSPPAAALADAIATLQARALFEGPTLAVNVRTAGHDNRIYLDLGDDQWRVVEIDRNGWRIVTDPPVRFWRPAGMRPLPLPQHGGRLEDLRGFIDAGSDEQWRLLAGWLVAAIRPPGQPYPVLVLHGEQGSAKSTTARMLRELVDPNQAPLRAAPSNAGDLMISASASWMLVLDNLSHVREWLSDALCRISTGGGYATRELYTSDGERIFDVQRPVILNGIEEVATRSDLLDRSVLINLPPIPPQWRRPQAELLAEFEEARPEILGGLLDAVSGALGRHREVVLPVLPRMADFAVWVTAAEPALGWSDGTFIEAYAANSGRVHQLALENSSIGQELLAIGSQGFEGTASQLLDLLNERTPDRSNSRGWPRNARAVSSHVRRLAPDLRAEGIDVTFDRTNEHRLIILTPSGRNTVTTVTTVTAGDGGYPF